MRVAAGIVALLLWVLPTASYSLELTRLRFDDGTYAVTAVGEITENDAARLGAITSTPGFTEMIVLDSNGGLVREALAIGDIIRKRGWDVYIPAGASCLSACIYAMAGGVERDVGEGSVVGVHQFYGGLDASSAPSAVQGQTQRMAARILSHLNRMGVKPAVLSIAMETPPEQIYAFSWRELAYYGVVTDSCPWPPDYQYLDPMGFYPGCIPSYQRKF